MQDQDVPSEFPLPFSRLSAIRAGVLTAVLVSLVTFLSLAALDQLAVQIEGETVKEGLSRVARAAAGLVDGDLHNGLRRPDQMNSEEYRRVLEPLVRFHRDIPEIAYLYSLIEKDGELFYVLDTASAAGRLGFDREMEVSAIMESAGSFSPEEDAAVLAALKAGAVYVSRKPFSDRYGTFMSAHAPIKDSSGKVVGLIGVDMDVKEFVARLHGLHLMGFGGAALSAVVGVILGILVFRMRSQGMSAAREAEQTLEAKSELEARDRRLIQAIGQIIYHHRFDIDRITWAGDCPKILGYAGEEMVVTTEEWLKCIHPDDRAREEEAYQRAAKGDGNYDAIYRYRRKDGSYAWMHDRGVAMRGPDGAVTCVDGVLEDISEKKEAEQEKMRLEQRNSLLIQALGQIAYHLDMKTGIIQWHGDHQSILGFSAEEMAVDYSTWLEAVHREDRARWKAACDESVRGGALCEIEYRHRCRDGSYKWILDRSVPTMQAGKAVAFDGVLLDISARKAAERDVIAARDAAEAANRAKSEFLAVMSHEIRTPLNGVIGFSSLLLEMQPTTQQKEYLQSVCLCSDMLLKLLNDILDFSKMESGNMEIEQVEFPIRGCVKEVLDIHAALAKDKGIALVSRFGEEVPAWILGDHARFRQVLTNLVGNAVKFTERGEVAVLVERLDHGTVPRLKITVKDTGIGIPVEKTDRLFRAFSQVDSSTTRKYGGTGLGLAISSKLVRMMGGALEVASVPGRGSEFFFDLPLSAAEAPGHPVLAPDESEAPREAASHFADGFPRILVVEDNALNRKVILRMLEKLGYQPSLVGNGRECLEAVKQGEFDMILMDLQMPEMDGFEATTRLRTAGYGVWITALTADAMPEDPLKCRIAGMNDYLSKPVTLEHLRAAIARYLAHFPSLSPR